MVSQQEDKSVHEYVEQAFAAYRARLQAADYVPPVQRVPQAPPRFRRKHDVRKEMDAAMAFEWIDMADAYSRDRLEAKTLDAAEIWAVYSQTYRHRYNPRKQPFPAERLAKIRLTTLQWHDVFQRVKQYTGVKKSWDDQESAQDPLLEPFGLMVVMAKKVEANRSKNQWRRNQGVAYLGKLGLYVGNMTLEQRRVVKDQYFEEQRHPRTYL